MFKILLYFGLGYFAYVVIKKVAAALGLWPQAPRPLEKNQEPDVLVQDPVCKTFIPRREALRAEKDGTTYFFCSEGCLKRFLSSDRS
jgi:YHS domain-containing protein